jgi:hypothetical protein
VRGVRRRTPKTSATARSAATPAKVCSSFPRHPVLNPCWNGSQCTGTPFNIYWKPTPGAPMLEWQYNLKL